MANPPSLGDLKPTFVRVQETHELPNSRKAVVAKFESILDTGGVQKILVELGQPIRVERLVAVNEGPQESAELPDEDILATIRNSEVIEVNSQTSGNAYKDLFRVFNFLTKKRLKPALIIVHTLDELDDWLGLEKPTHLEELFGVEVRPSAGVEEHTLLLLGSPVDDPSVITSTLRLIMEKPDEANRSEGPQERNRGKRNGRATGEMG